MFPTSVSESSSSDDEFDENNSETLFKSQARSSTINHSVGNRCREYKMRTLSEKLDSDEESHSTFGSVSNISELDEETDNSDVQRNTETDEEIDVVKPVAPKTNIYKPKNIVLNKHYPSHKRQRLTKKLPLLDEPIVISSESEEEKDVNVSSPNLSFRTKTRNSDVQLNTETDEEIYAIKPDVPKINTDIYKPRNIVLKNYYRRLKMQRLAKTLPLFDEPILISSESEEEKDVTFPSPNLSVNTTDEIDEVKPDVVKPDIVKLDIVKRDVENIEQTLTTNSSEQEMNIISPNAEIAIETSVLENNTLQQESVSVSTEEHSSLSNELSNNYEFNKSNWEVENSHDAFENDIMNTNTNFFNDIHINQFNITEDISPDSGLMLSNRSETRSPTDRNNLTNTDNILVENNRTVLDPCPVCYNALVRGETMSTICGHIFCSTCGKIILKRTKTCPTCRKRITPSKIHPLFF